MGANWSDVLFLISVEEGTDDQGFPAIVESEPRMVYANKLSIRSNEYYMAKQSGIELTYMFEIRSVEYDGEEKVKLSSDENAESYDIERTYEKGEFIELVLRKHGDDHAS